MSATNPGAIFRYNLAGRTSGIIRSFIIGNIQTLTVGDFVRLTSGYIVPAAATNLLLGVVVGIVDKNGINMDETKYSFAQATWTSSTDTVVTGAANTTGDQVRALVDVDPFSVWSVEPDSAIGQDTESDMAGAYTDLIDANEVDEDGATTGIAQLFIWGVDPENSARGLYSIAESQLWGV